MFARRSFIPLLLAAMGCGHQTDAQVHSSQASACIDTLRSEAISLLDLGGRTVVFENGGVAAFPDAILVAGVQSDAASNLSTEAGRETRVARVFHAQLGEIPLPSRNGRPPIDAPVPVLLSKERWGLVWAEAVARGNRGASWSADRFTEVWFAEWNQGAWSEPRRVLRANFGIDWLTARTFAYTPERGTVMMTTTEEHVTERHLVFGPVDGELRRVPLGPGLQPYAAAFVPETEGSITAAVQAGRSGPAGQHLEIMLLRSADGGRTWSKPEAVWATDAIVSGLRVHRDQDHQLHLVWTDGFTNVRHIFQAEATGPWTESRLPNAEGRLAFSGRTGIDRCGRLTLAREIADATGNLTLHLTSWTGDRWVVRNDVGGDLAINLFDGRGYDGVWYVAWSGPRVSGGDMKLFVLAP